MTGCVPAHVDREFRVEIKLRNNRLKARRLALGLSNAELCRRLGLGEGYYGNLENLTRVPVNRKGQWNRYARALAAFYQTTEEDLFPDAVLAVTKPEIVREIGAAEIGAIAACIEPPQLPDQAAESAEESAWLRSAIDTLTPREQSVLRRRFGLDGEEATQGDIGRELRISAMTVGHIQGRAMRKLRRFASRVRFNCEP